MGYNYIPKYIRQSENKSPKSVVTASRWNQLFNLLIQQGDHTAEELGKILDYLSTNIANAITGEHEYASALEIHLHTDTNPITADKTFAEIRQAILDGREITLWVSDVQCLKPACKVYEGSIILAAFGPNVPGQALYACLYRCSDEDDWYVMPQIKLADQAYVDGHVNEKLDKTGGVISGNLGVTGALNIGATVAITETNNNLLQLAGDYGAPVTISNVDTPVADNDAATKKYVDDHAGGGGTSDHSQLTNRDAANQHPITAITGLQTALDGKADAANIPSLEGYATEAYVQNYHDNTKQDIITDLATIRSGASKGATAVQPETGKGLFSGSYNDLTDKPAIPDAVTEGTVSGWGFTKNTGTYSKPAGGIPKADLANDVQASLGKADSALQEHQSLAAYRTALEQNRIDNGKVDKVTGKGLSSNDYTDAAKAKVDALALVATSGSYNDLTDKPTIPTEVTPLIGTIRTLTPTQVYDAVSAGVPVKVQYTDGTYGLLSFTAFNIAESLSMIVAQAIVYYNSVYILAELGGNIQAGNWFTKFTVLAEKSDIPTIPTALKNPNALTIKIGSTTVTYDGSTAQTVTIDDGTEVSY